MHKDESANLLSAGMGSHLSKNTSVEKVPEAAGAAWLSQRALFLLQPGQVCSATELANVSASQIGSSSLHPIVAPSVVELDSL